jgi:hypothetical protein
MDDIDIGVDSIEDGRRVLRDMDLILHTRQVRLNAGKTLILRKEDAERHFRVRENMLLNNVVRRIDRKRKKDISLDSDRKYIRRALHKYYRKRKFDGGNGDKILNRLMNISKLVDAKVDLWLLRDILRRRPTARSAAFGVIGWQFLTPKLTALVVSFLTSEVIVDEWTYIEGANALVQSEAKGRPAIREAALSLGDHLSQKGFFGVYAAVWLLSKYGDATDVYQYLDRTQAIWGPDLSLGRLVGGLSPIFYATDHEGRFLTLVRSARNAGADEVMEFHRNIRSDPKTVAAVTKIIGAVNTSKRLGITHAKYLLLLSILANSAISDRLKARHLLSHKRAWRDVFYRRRARAVVASPNLRVLVTP